MHVEIAAGTRLGPYEVTGLIGAGGMGEVYRGRDTRLGRDVAIKVIPSRLAANAHVRDRLIREARAISSLAHPNICTLFDIGHQDGVDYLVMEYLEGQTLAEGIARGPLPLEQVLRYGAQIASAVAAAHRQGIVHRDLKPGNIMLTKSGVKVLDFGLATSERDVASEANDQTEQRPLTEAGAVVGTLQYMAPEQLRGADADARSDIFALGTIVYEMTTGRRAFEGTTRTSVVASILETEPPRIATLVPMSPPALDQLVRKCLAKDPDDRLQSASDLEFALQQITQPEQIAPAKARRAWLSLATIVVLLIGAVAASWIVARRRSAADAAAPKTVAVLPFENLGGDHSRDYLLLAIPDEITTILTYSPELAVRPFSASRRVHADTDPEEAAKKLNAGAIVSGHLMDANGRLNVTLEAIDVAKDKVLWRDVFEVGSADLITMRGELSDRIRTGLLPRLAGGAALQEGSGPKNTEAYALYLRASAVSPDPEPNKEALRLLKDAVRLDPSYGAAWSALSQREYYDYEYSDGGEAAMQRSDEAATRALQLDPNLPEAATLQIVIRTERGQTIEALNDAKRLVERRPGSADAHFNLSYVLRYGGALAESAAECEKAWTIDHGNRAIRSCAQTFLLNGNTDRTLDFASIDPGTLFSKRMIAGVLTRQGKYDEVIRVTGPNRVGNLLTAWRSGRAEDVDRATARLVESNANQQDGEPYYVLSGYLSLCGRPALALNFLRESVRRNYCWVPAIDSDPTYAAVRALPEFAPVHAEAAQCHERFMAELKK